jgi:hypothetical protein
LQASNPSGLWCLMQTLLDSVRCFGDMESVWTLVKIC